MAARGPRPSLASRAATMTDAEVNKSLGKIQHGFTCQGLFCDREATRFAGGEWRCGACPDPRPVEISAELGAAWGDPHRRWRMARYAVSRTQREEAGAAGEATA